MWLGKVRDSLQVQGEQGHSQAGIPIFLTCSS
jgi:hypothetical protein